MSRNTSWLIADPPKDANLANLAHLLQTLYVYMNGIMVFFRAYSYRKVVKVGKVGK